jgi:nitric oxide reductase large subunit
MFKNTCLRTLPFFISFLIIGTVLGWLQSYGDLSYRIWETVKSGLALGIFSCFLCFAIFLIPPLIKHSKENKKQRILVIRFFLVFIIISILSFFLSYSNIMSDFRSAESMGMHYMGTMADLRGLAFTCGIGWGLHALFYSFYFYLLYKLYSSKNTIKMILGYILTMSMFIIFCCSFLL